MNTNKNIDKTMMLKTFRIIVLTIAFGAFLSCDSDDTQTVTTLDNLVWSDEFDAEGSPNSEFWSFEVGRGPNNDGWGNDELQYYTDRTENVQIQNGVLLITARDELAATGENYEGAQYTSGRIITKGKVEEEYGRYEARIRLPYGQGIWPAFWMLGADIDDNPWPGAGEIDVMEYLGQNPTVAFGTVHGPGYSGGESIGKEYDLVNDRFDTGFHIFGIEWGPNYINFYVDDVLYNQITPSDVPGDWVFNKPFYILLNVAVGGALPGSPNEETVFPQTMIVDYVRVYQ